MKDKKTFYTETREEQAERLFSSARAQRSTTDDYWKKMRAYYDGCHDTARQTGDFLSSIDLPWVPASVPDAYMHVESQIDSHIPDFEFSGRGDGDRAFASEREKVVRYVCDINDMETKNAVNERRLGLYGSAVWKLSVGISDAGDAEIKIENPSPECIFTDPAAVSTDECEYIIYTYKMSRLKARRVFAEDIRRENTSLDDIIRESNRRGGVFAPDKGGDDCELIDITEYWFRQPEDGTCVSVGADGKNYIYSYKAGDIALSILICGREIRYIPKFWESTGCTKYPIVIYNRIPREGSIWGRSEIDQIIPLIDAADRQLAFAQLNTAFSASDIIVCEENAFSPDCYPESRPGAVWKLRPGMTGKVGRLGGLCESGGHYEIVERYRSLMKEALGNYDFLLGDSATKVTTATGLAILSDFANKRVNSKNACKKAGFSRLYLLIDCLALEIYGREKLESIGVVGEDMPCDGIDYINRYGYVPEVDIRIHIGDAMEYSRSLAMSALKTIMDSDITEENYPVVREYIRTMELPECAELLSELDGVYKNGSKEEKE